MLHTDGVLLGKYDIINKYIKINVVKWAVSLRGESKSGAVSLDIKSLNFVE